MGSNIVAMDDSLGLPGGAARIHDVGGVVGGRARGWRFGFPGRSGPGAVVQKSRPAGVVGDDQTSGLKRKIFLDGLDFGRQRVAGDQGYRVRVADERCQAGAPEQWTERHRHRSHLGDRPVEIDQLEAVRQEQGDLVSLGDAESDEGIGRPVNSGIQLAPGVARSFEDQRFTVGVVERVPGGERTDVHGHHGLLRLGQGSVQHRDQRIAGQTVLVGLVEVPQLPDLLPNSGVGLGVDRSGH